MVVHGNEEKKTLPNNFSFSLWFSNMKWSLVSKRVSAAGAAAALSSFIENFGSKTAII